MLLKITNGVIYTEDGPTTGDLIVRDGKVAGIERAGSGSACDTVFDAQNCPVLPGLIDMHVHIDDNIGGVALADDFFSASKIAAVNGITTLVGFATQKPGESLYHAVASQIAKGRNHSFVDFSVHFTPTSFSDEDFAQMVRLIGMGFRTIKLYTTYKEAGLYTSFEQIDSIMSRLRGLDVAILVHCEHQDVLDSVDWCGLDTGDPSCASLTRPESAETEAIAKIIELAKLHLIKTHIVHVSTPKGVDLVAEARQNAPITCETAPQYLTLTDQEYSKPNGHRLLLTPPFRSESRRAGLLSRACDGKCDVFATDHCAFSKEHKDRFKDDFQRVPKGLPGIGALVPVVYEMFKKHSDKGEERLFTSLARALSANPAKVCGIYPRKGSLKAGADADIVVLKREPIARAIRSSLMDVFEPYPEAKSGLVAGAVFLRGQLVATNGSLQYDNKPTGRSIWHI